MKKQLLMAAAFLALTTAGKAQRGPGNPRLSALVAMEDKAAIQDSIKALYQSNNEDDLQLLVNYYAAKKEGEKSTETADFLMKRFPNGKAAFNEIAERIYNETDPEVNEKNYKELVSRFGSDPRFNLDGSAYFVAVTFLGKNKPGKVMEYLQKIKNKTYETNAYSYAAREAIKAKDYQLGEKLIRKTFADLKGDTAHRGMDEFARIFSELMLANGKYEEGFPYAKRVYDKQSKNTTVSFNELKSTYLSYLVKLNKYKEAFPLMEEQIRAGAASPLVKEKFKAAYIAANGSENGYAALVERLDKELKEKVREEVTKKMINTVAYNFELKDLNGKTVKLSDFKDKVVILDFWATWCAPCKASFPMMQSAVNRYKNDKDVVFLFIHTMETSANATQLAGDYIKGQKYTFNVLMDLKDPATKTNAAANGYKVRGIPSKFIIDGAGNIRFSTLGHSAAGTDAFLEEMDAMIDIARKGV